MISVSPRQASLAAVACLAASILAAVLLTPGSSAHFDSADYAFERDTCFDSTAIDPITVVFYGDRAEASNARTHIIHHTQWRNNQGKKQFFLSEGHCTGDEGDQASGCGTCSRMHIRVNQNHDRDQFDRYFTVGTPHDEDMMWFQCDLITKWPSCKKPCHAVDENGPDRSGFERGRAEIASTFFAGGHERVLDNWANRRNFQQCDEKEAGNESGAVWWIGIGPGDQPPPTKNR
jgi:hypothetical protein